MHCTNVSASYKACRPYISKQRRWQDNQKSKQVYSFQDLNLTVFFPGEKPTTCRSVCLYKNIYFFLKRAKYNTVCLQMKTAPSCPILLFSFTGRLLIVCTGTFPLSRDALRTNLQQDIKMIYLIQNRDWKTSIWVSSGVWFMLTIESNRIILKYLLYENSKTFSNINTQYLWNV